MNWNNVFVAATIFLVIVLAIVVLLLVAKKFLVASGKVAIHINDKETLDVESGKTLLSTLNENGIHLSSACGGKGSCGQCKVQVPAGGGEMLPTESVHFSRRQMKENWRLGCQVKVKNDMNIIVSESLSKRKRMGM